MLAARVMLHRAPLEHRTKKWTHFWIDPTLILLSERIFRGEPEVRASE
jgi:hypothetical protein